MNSAVDRPSSVNGRTGGAKQKFDVDAFAKSYGGTTRLTLRSGARLYVQGEPADSLFHVQTGQIQLAVVSPVGKEAILSVLGAGDFCGESCLVADHVRAATAMCITDSVVARLERGNVIRAIREDPAFAEFFVVSVIARAFRLRDSLISQLFDSTERRLARVLLVLANYGKEGATAIDHYDQEALAQMIGTTRSRVNHFMNKFRKLGYIDYNGHIDVHSSLLNVVLHDDPLIPAEDRKKASA
jgi:CRP/FNR family transcriptional regulator, cyclic AMP receptor protein